MIVFILFNSLVPLALPILTFLAACAVLRTAATSSTKCSDLEAWQEEEVGIAMQQKVQSMERMQSMQSMESTNHQLLSECNDKSLESCHVKLGSFAFSGSLSRSPLQGRQCHQARPMARSSCRQNKRASMKQMQNCKPTNKKNAKKGRHSLGGNI